MLCQTAALHQADETRHEHSGKIAHGCMFALMYLALEHHHRLNGTRQFQFHHHTAERTIIISIRLCSRSDAAHLKRSLSRRKLLFPLNRQSTALPHNSQQLLYSQIYTRIRFRPTLFWFDISFCQGILLLILLFRHIILSHLSTANIGWFFYRNKAKEKSMNNKTTEHTPGASDSAHLFCTRISSAAG